MDVSKIEKLIADLIKHGDKKTMKIVSDLLTEISVLEAPKKSESKPKEQPKEEPKPVTESLANRASSVLDSLSSYGGSSIFSQPRTAPPPARNQYIPPAQPQHYIPQAPPRAIHNEEYASGFNSMFGAAPIPQAPTPTYTPVEDHGVPDIPYTPAPPVQGFDSAITNYAALL